jgi:hypothetical protein
MQATNKTEPARSSCRSSQGGMLFGSGNLDWRFRKNTNVPEKEADPRFDGISWDPWAPAEILVVTQSSWWFTRASPRTFLKISKSCFSWAVPHSFSRIVQSFKVNLKLFHNKKGVLRKKNQFILLSTSHFLGFVLFCFLAFYLVMWWHEIFFGWGGGWLFFKNSFWNFKATNK